MVNKSSYLAHAGVKGMKWGVRRYQNADGSLTPAGKKRYTRDQHEQSLKKPKNRVESLDPKRWVHEDMERTKRVLDSGEDMTRKVNRAIDAVPPKKPPVKDLSKMSDKELRDAINRKMLEKQYNDMCTPQKVSKGREYTKTALEITGSVMAVGSTALGMALAIKQLLGK